MAAETKAPTPSSSLNPDALPAADQVRRAVARLQDDEREEGGEGGHSAALVELAKVLGAVLKRPSGSDDEEEMIFFPASPREFRGGPVAPVGKIRAERTFFLVCLVTGYHEQRSVCVVPGKIAF
jgi:hypothetical protein